MTRLLIFVTGLVLGSLITLIFIDWVNPSKSYHYHFNISEGVIVNNGKIKEKGKVVEFDLVEENTMRKE